MECLGFFDVLLHSKDDVRVALENVAVLPDLAFDLMSFNCIQEKYDILTNRDGTWIPNDRVHFVKIPVGNYIRYSVEGWRWSSCDGGGDYATRAAQ